MGMGLNVGEALLRLLDRGQVAGSIVFRGQPNFRGAYEGFFEDTGRGEVIQHCLEADDHRAPGGIFCIRDRLLLPGATTYTVGTSTRPVGPASVG